MPEIANAPEPRYAPRLVPPGTTPSDALVEPLIENPPTSPFGEHELIPQVAWMVERAGSFVYVPASERPHLEAMRGSAIETMLEDELASEVLEQLPGINFATNGTYAAELLLDGDHLAEIHQLLKAKAYLAAAPRRGRLLVGGVGGGVEGMRAFIEHARSEHDAAPLADRISPVTLLVRDGAPKAIVGELQLKALAQAIGER
jgi:hypothetical protein